MIGQRLDDAADPPWRAEATRRLVRLNAQGLIDRLPGPLAERLRMESFAGTRCMVMTVPADTSLACDAEEIAQGLAPDGAVALAAVRPLFGL